MTETQKLAHRLEREKYNLVHPTLGTITKARAEELWATNYLGTIAKFPKHPRGLTEDENKIVRFLWDQIESGSSSWMSAFFIYVNQEPL